jgi:hypothetical protein
VDATNRKWPVLLTPEYYFLDVADVLGLLLADVPTAFCAFDFKGLHSVAFRTIQRLSLGVEDPCGPWVDRVGR